MAKRRLPAKYPMPSESAHDAKQRMMKAMLANQAKQRDFALTLNRHTDEMRRWPKKKPLTRHYPPRRAYSVPNPAWSRATVRFMVWKWAAIAVGTLGLPVAMLGDSSWVVVEAIAFISTSLNAVIAYGDVRTLPRTFVSQEQATERIEKRGVPPEVDVPWDDGSSGVSAVVAEGLIERAKVAFSKDKLSPLEFDRWVEDLVWGEWEPKIDPEDRAAFWELRKRQIEKQLRVGESRDVVFRGKPHIARMTKDGLLLHPGSLADVKPEEPALTVPEEEDGFGRQMDEHGWAILGLHAVPPAKIGTKRGPS